MQDLNREFCLSENSIHLWFFRATESWGGVLNNDKMLSLEEAQRAAKFVNSQDARVYRVSHNLLRILSGHYERVFPKNLNFQREPGGRPYLPKSNLKFSLAHSGDGILLGFCLNETLGVDLEMVREVDQWKTLAKSYFHHFEYQEVLSHSMGGSEFLRLWVLKEAFLKWLGTGLTEELSSFFVRRIDMGEPNAYCTEFKDKVCQIRYLPLNSEFVAAVAMGENSGNIVMKSLSDGRELILKFFDRDH